MEEGRLLLADVYERGLNARQDRIHAAQKNVTGQAALIRSVEHEVRRAGRLP